MSSKINMSTSRKLISKQFKEMDKKKNIYIDIYKKKKSLWV